LINFSDYSKIVSSTKAPISVLKENFKALEKTMQVAHFISCDCFSVMQKGSGLVYYVFINEA